MPSHMGVQQYATERNEQAETLIDFVIRKFVTRLYNDGFTSSVTYPQRQRPFERPDCKDVFDHYVELDLVRPIGEATGKLQIWAQTTCYKGNTTGKPESNKTYEIRETLIESLGLRRWLREEHKQFRTVHFTLGPTNYTYGWFKAAKDNAFDLSLYLDATEGSRDVFLELNSMFSGATSELECTKRLELALQDPMSLVGKTVCEMSNRLYDWFISGLPTSSVADRQSDLMSNLGYERAGLLEYALAAAKNGGADIKGRVQGLLTDGSAGDSVMARTIKRLFSGNPFLPISLDAESNWESWSITNFAPQANDRALGDYVSRLWNAYGDNRLVNRRLLLRIHADASISYIQDIGIPGVDEHNLYNGQHTEAQVRDIVSRILESYRRADIHSVHDLHSRLTGNAALTLLRASRRFESKNGTNIKPSFYYVEEALSDSYVCLPFKNILPPPVAYHASFSDAAVDAYDNLKVVVERASWHALAIIKAKYFRQQEFARRAKEEAYVGLTAKYIFEDGRFVERYPGIPLIMFVDMPAKLKPLEYAVRRLVTAGWDTFFSVEELRAFLDRLASNRA